MKNNLLDTKTANLNEILGNGKIYNVPLYQRDYSWEQEHWEDLWEDILEVEKADFPHYMGAIVFQNIDNKKFIVIDGQQRLATLSIIIIACINHLNKLIQKGIDINDNQERIDLLMNQYLGTKDSVSLLYSSKLFLNENNDAFYQGTLLQFKKPVNERKLKDSEKLLWDAFLYYEKKIDEKFHPENSGKKIASFINNVLAEKLAFIQIKVEDDLSAYTVFETLNSRGIGLTSTDLLKNYLFSKVSSSDTSLNHVRSQWKKIIDVIGMNEFSTFLRHYINSFDDLVTKDKLFKRLKNKIDNEAEVYSLLDELESTAYLYKALSQPEDDFWMDFEAAKAFVRELNLFKVTQYKPLVISVYKKFDPKNVVKTLRLCSIISFRYNVIGRLHTNDLEKAFNKAAIKVDNGVVKDARELFNELKSVYVSDEVFSNSFSTKSLNTRSYKKLVRYILVKIESQISGRDIDFEETSATIEHILPESYDESLWGNSFSEDDHMNLVNRLGNHTLLEPSLNNEAANKGFDEKKSVFAKSTYSMTKDIDQADWSPTTLKHRQSKLAKLAKGIWKMDF